MTKPGAQGNYRLARNVLFFVIALTCTWRLAAQTPAFQVVQSFNGANGYHSTAPLIQGSDGNFYGTTRAGGTANEGTVFQVTPAGVLTSLYSFTGSVFDGGPAGGLTLGNDGNFYGTTAYGPDPDPAEGGTIFKITPAGMLTTLYTFTGNPGGNSPTAGLTLGSDGNFYGVTTGGGIGVGTVFQITPAGVLTYLYTFSGGADGALPEGALIESGGNFYGATLRGGDSNGDGTIFQITPAGVLTTFYTFTGGANGANPASGLILGRDGNFYGTTGNGGDSNGDGTVFQITPAGVLTTLYTFTGGADGSYPAAGLVQASDGNFYGTTGNGGAGAGVGTIFKITSAGALTTLFTFAGSAGVEGENPLAALIQGSDGNLYGTTKLGGQNGDGLIYRVIIVPPVVASQTASAQVGSPFSFQIAATNSPTSFGASNLPPGLTVDPLTGIISGTSTQSGVFSVGLTATNSIGTSSGTLSLTISPAPVQPPAVTSGTASAQVGSAFSFQIVATNSPTSFAASNLPAGLSLDAASGIISGTPTQSGTFTVGLSATNSGGAGSGTLTLTVNPATPVITSSPSATGQAGQPFNYQITAGNTPTSFGASGLPAGLSVDAGTGVISGTPAVSGTFSVGLSAANAGGTGNSVLTITLAPALPVVSLAAKAPQVVLGSGHVGKFALTLPAPQSVDVIVAFTIKGSAINGVDYQLIKASKKIKAGKTRKIIKIVPLGDLEGASKKVVTFVLNPGTGYTIGTTGKVKVKILSATSN